MKTQIKNYLAIPAVALIFSTGVMAEKSESVVVALKTDQFEVAETDIGHLAVGEAETIVTENGKTIDLLRTADGVEIYVDGELLDIGGLSGQHLSGDVHVLREHHAIKCVVTDELDEDVACDDEMIFINGDDVDIEALHEGGDAHGIIIKRIEKECSSEEEGECEDHHVWLSDNGLTELDGLHGTGHKVIRIHKSADGEVDLDVELEKD